MLGAYDVLIQVARWSYIEAPTKSSS